MADLAKLALEDGTVYTGRAFGAPGETFGEVVFNTSMTGYQEVLTDPSYKGQIVTMTYPLIGNYGINRQDVESRQPHVAGFIIKELPPVYSNYRADMSLEQYLAENRIIGIEGIDTRALTRKLRISGAMRSLSVWRSSSKVNPPTAKRSSQPQLDTTVQGDGHEQEEP